jgi:uncharacterized membrane protein
VRRFQLLSALVLLLCTSALAQESVRYHFTNINYPNDTFIQLLGINDKGAIAGYHNFNLNQGFTLELPHDFTTENFPQSMQTQVIGVNNLGNTAGFYIDNNGATHGFLKKGSSFTTVDFPGIVTSQGTVLLSAFNQLLGLNDRGQAAGYLSLSANNTTPDFPYIYDEVGGAYQLLAIPGAVNGAQATGINNAQQICGFYIDQNNVNHGFLLNFGSFKTLDFPGGTGTQALGLNNRGQVVGSYTDSAGMTHGFVYYIENGRYQSVDDPDGVGTTFVNGINDEGRLVGFFGTNPVNTGFVATPEE